MKRENQTFSVKKEEEERRKNKARKTRNDRKEGKFQVGGEGRPRLAFCRHDRPVLSLSDPCLQWAWGRLFNMPMCVHEEERPYMHVLWDEGAGQTANCPPVPNWLCQFSMLNEEGENNLMGRAVCLRHVMCAVSFLPTLSGRSDWLCLFYYVWKKRRKYLPMLLSAQISFCVWKGI